MKQIEVYADFDWLAEPMRIGTLSYEQLRGSDSYGFTFDKTWLQRHADVFLCPDLNPYPGPQYGVPGRDIFGCFSDALPDRWGRTLLNRREQIHAADEHRPARRLSSFDYLLGIDDYARMGGLRFKLAPDGPFVNVANELRIPPLTEVQVLIEASQEVERCEERNELPGMKWIAQLVQPGSSLGGARPKANVVDEAGAIMMAKFPSRKDDYDVALWEHLCHLLAAQAGIKSAQTRVISVGSRYHTLLSRRFDRTSEGRRIHFASAMTLLGMVDGDNADSGHGYLDIVDFIVQHCTDVEANLRELYRRVAFNICVGNTDDHFRNHGFLLTAKGWTLSPAYDINPTNQGYQSLLISASDNRSDLSVLLSASEEYLIPRPEAETIILEVVQAVRSWRTIATRLGLTTRDQARFADSIDKNCD
jgi:serine/threonine-protein kinase HipA